MNIMLFIVQIYTNCDKLDLNKIQLVILCFGLILISYCTSLLYLLQNKILNEYSSFILQSRDHC